MYITNGTIKSLRAGGTTLVKKMDDKLGLSKIIQKQNIKKKGLELEKITLSMISSGIDEPNSVSQTVKHIKDNSTALMEFDIEPSKVHQKTYYRGLEFLGKNDKEIYGSLIDVIDEKYHLDLSVVFADWTSSYFCGKKAGISKRGYSKDHRPGNEQIKLGLAITDKMTVAFHYSVEEGNLVDIPHLENDFKKIKKRLPKKALLVFDKGGKSKKNCKLIHGEYHYLTGVRDDAPFRKKIRSINKSKKKMTMITKDEDGKKIFALREKKGDIYRYYYKDEKREDRDVKKRKKEIDKKLKEKNDMLEIFKKNGAKGLRKKLTKKKKVTKFLNDVVVTTEVTVQKRLVKIGDEKIVATFEKDKELDGFFALESSKRLDPLYALNTYRRKDKVEKIICDVKSVHKVRPFRVWNDDEIKGLVLICMIAMLFVGLAKEDAGFLKKSRKTIVGWLKNLTVVIAYDDLGKMTHKMYANVTTELGILLNLPQG